MSLGRKREKKKTVWIRLHWYYYCNHTTHSRRHSSWLGAHVCVCIQIYISSLLLLIYHFDRCHCASSRNSIPWTLRTLFHQNSLARSLLCTLMCDTTTRPQVEVTSKCVCVCVCIWRASQAATVLLLPVTWWTTRRRPLSGWPLSVGEVMHAGNYFHCFISM